MEDFCRIDGKIHPKETLDLFETPCSPLSASKAKASRFTSPLSIERSNLLDKQRSADVLSANEKPKPLGAMLTPFSPNPRSHGSN